MDALVLIEDAAVRDNVLVGLRNVPGIKPEAPLGFPNIDRAKRRAYHAIFIDHDPNRGGANDRLQRIHELAPKAEVVVVAESRATRALAPERARLKIAAFLDLPLNVTEFFRLAVRLRKRADSVPH